MNESSERNCRPKLHLPMLEEVTTDCLHDGLPLTLLLDLSEPTGPNSSALFRAEGGDDVTGGLCTDVDWSDDARLDATMGAHWTRPHA